MSEYIKFGISSRRNVTFNYVDDQYITKAEWALFSDKEKDVALEEFVWSCVEAWVEEE